MISKSLASKGFFIREVFYKTFKISVIKHIYRSYIKANIVSLAHKYFFLKDLVKRFLDQRNTKKKYRGLKNLIRFKIETKKISQAFKSKNYALLIKRIFLIVFAGPIRLLNKLKPIKIWLQSLLKEILIISGKKK